jgi:hypothetical protein
MKLNSMNRIHYTKYNFLLRNSLDEENMVNRDFLFHSWFFGNFFFSLKLIIKKLKLWIKILNLQTKRSKRILANFLC